MDEDVPPGQLDGAAKRLTVKLPSGWAAADDGADERRERDAGDDQASSSQRLLASGRTAARNAG